MEHSTPTLDTAENIDELIASTRSLAERYPALVPLIPELIAQIDLCADIDDSDALACLRFHYKHPALAELLMRLAGIAHEQGIGKQRPSH